MRWMVVVAMLVAMRLCAQDAMAGMKMDDSSMAGMKMDAPMTKQIDTKMYLMRVASGTSMNPAAARVPMKMQRVGGTDDWMLMWMGQAFVVDTQQTGPRAGDKFYSVNWGMLAAEHRLAGGTMMLQMMASLEPATVTGRKYPELFQTGETAYGKPIVDGQHPHNAVMGLGAQYARALGAGGVWEIYYAPVGDPALGPVAFPHRASAVDLPQAPLGHHWEDSTHIAANVATVAAQEKYSNGVELRVEASGFYGTEPGENRWAIGWGPMNSWSTRVSVMPTAEWKLTASVGRLKNPERFQVGDVVRSTADVAWSKPIGGGRVWSTDAIWGRNHDAGGGRNTNAYLLETVWPVTKKDSVTGRAEMVAKDDLFADTPVVAQHLAATVGSVFTVKAVTAGYSRVVGQWHAAEFALGANMTGYGVPGAIQPYYGQHPVGADLFLRVRLK